MAGGLTYEIKGLDALERKLEEKALYWDVVKDALDKAGAEGAKAARAEAGRFRLTGVMEASVSHKVNSVPAPRWAVVKVEATSRTGRRYPWILEFDARYGHKNWLRDAVRTAQSQITAIISRAASDIESRWGA